MNFTADARDAPDQPLPVPYGHEVLHLADALRREEARDQDVGIGNVELLGRAVLDRGDPVEATVAAVEDRAEDAGRIEAERAVPVDRPVVADQSDRAQVADHAVVGNRKVIAGGPLARPKAGRDQGGHAVNVEPTRRVRIGVIAGRMRRATATRPTARRATPAPAEESMK